MKNFAVRHSDLAAEVHAQIEACIVRLRELGIDLAFPEVSYGVRGTAAGQAHYLRHSIRLNAKLLLENRADFVRVTVPHEIAHLAVHTVHGRKVRPHGREWQAIMQAFGVAPERCHRYPVRYAGKTYLYRCQCEAIEFSARRHALARRRIYWCTRCNGRMRLLQTTAN